MANSIWRLKLQIFTFLSLTWFKSVSVVADFEFIIKSYRSKMTDIIWQTQMEVSNGNHSIQMGEKLRKLSSGLLGLAAYIKRKKCWFLESVEWQLFKVMKKSSGWFVVDSSERDKGIYCIPYSWSSFKKRTTGIEKQLRIPRTRYTRWICNVFRPYLMLYLK